jgi:hypothetical protein
MLMSSVDDKAIRDELTPEHDAPIVPNDGTPTSPWLLVPPLILASDFILKVNRALWTFARAWVVNSPQEKIIRARCLKLSNFRFKFGAIDEFYNKGHTKWHISMRKILNPKVHQSSLANPRESMNDAAKE